MQTTEVKWSNQPSFRKAATAPIRTPSTLPMTPAAATRTAELTSRGATCDQTPRPFASDVPVWPVRSPENHIQYWSTSPRFK